VFRSNGADTAVGYTPNATDYRLVSIATSSDGAVVLVGSNGTNIYVSTNSAATWTNRTLPTGFTGDHGWKVAVSWDGTKMVAASSLKPGTLFTSTNSGTTWSKQTSFPNYTASDIAMSSNGSIVYVGIQDVGGRLHRSVDGGATWVALASSPTQYYGAVACSADGRRVMAGPSQRLITAPYFTHETYPAWLRVNTSSGGNLAWSSDYGDTWAPAQCLSHPFLCSVTNALSVNTNPAWWG